MSSFPYTFIQHIGRGGYGDIYKVRHAHTGKHFACKLVKKSGATTLHNLKEVDMMIKLKGAKNVIDFHECYPYDNQLAIIMELCHGKDVRKSLEHIHDPFVRNQQREKYVLDCILAIRSCHENGIIHKDIKHTNFMVTNDTVKLIERLGVIPVFHKRFLALHPTGRTLAPSLA